MFKTLVFTALLVGTAFADMRNYTDIDALILAKEQQSNRSYIMEPPRDVYDEYHLALTKIREMVPHLEHIHATPNAEFGKYICKKNDIDWEKLNRSELGPLKVDYIGSGDYLITFSQPIEALYLGYHLERHYALDEFKTPDCRGLVPEASTTDIMIIGSYYHFIERSGDCFKECRHYVNHRFLVEGSNITKLREFVHDLDHLHDKSTTIKTIINTE